MDFDSSHYNLMAAPQDMMPLPLELAPLVFQFLPVETLRNFPEDDPLLVAVLSLQEGCRPFKVTYQYNGTEVSHSVEHMEIYLRETFSTEVFSSLGVVHMVHLCGCMPDAFASMFCKKDKADDSHYFPRAEALIISTRRKFSRIDLSIFPKLRKLSCFDRGITISPRSRTTLLNYISFHGNGSSVDGVCDVSSNTSNPIEINIDRSQGFIKLVNACVDWKPCFDRSWCRSMELRRLVYSVDKVASLQGFPNLKILKFVESKIELSQNWLPNIPLEILRFWDCTIEGTEFGFWPLVKKLEFNLCRMEPLKAHFPQLELLIYHDDTWLVAIDQETEENYERYLSVPIAKENLRKVKSLFLSTNGRRFNLSSFEELNDLEVWCSYRLTRLDGLNIDTLERVMIVSCPKLKVNFPRNVSVKVSHVSSQNFPGSEICKRLFLGRLDRLMI